MCPSLLSLRNRQQQQQSEPRSGYSTAYRNGYDQYSQYQQQAYPGYYPSWGYDPNAAAGYGYNYQQYDYSQYTPTQVSSLSVKQPSHPH